MKVFDLVLWSFRCFCTHSDVLVQRLFSLLPGMTAIEGESRRRSVVLPVAINDSSRRSVVFPGGDDDCLFRMKEDYVFQKRPAKVSRRDRLRSFSVTLALALVPDSFKLVCGERWSKVFRPDGGNKARKRFKKFLMSRLRIFRQEFQTRCTAFPPFLGEIRRPRKQALPLPKVDR